MKYIKNKGKNLFSYIAFCKSCFSFFHVKDKMRSKNAKYCSQKCFFKAQSKKVKLKCLVCNREFEVSPSSIKNGRKYCSRKCHYKSMELEKIQCPICNNYFSPKNKQQYCTLKCANKAQKSKIKKTCLVCGKKFKTVASRLKDGRGKYCSKYCYFISISGENNFNWKGGISFEPYCPKFNERTKEKVRNHFNNECFYCGKNKKENGKKLDVHHVNYDKGQGCSGKWLLIPLCTSCHTKTNHNRNYWEEYFTNWLASLNFECGI